MSNGAECCAIGVCCPGDDAARSASLAKILVRDGGISKDASEKAASCVIETFDLALKGTLEPLIESITKMAKHQAT